MYCTDNCRLQGDITVMANIQDIKFNEQNIQSLYLYSELKSEKISSMSVL